LADEILTLSEASSSLPERIYSPEFGHLAAELTAAELLAEDDASGSGSGGSGGRQGQMALKTMYRFICYNADWIQVELIIERTNLY